MAMKITSAEVDLIGYHWIQYNPEPPCALEHLYWYSLFSEWHLPVAVHTWLPGCPELPEKGVSGCKKKKWNNTYYLFTKLPFY